MLILTTILAILWSTMAFEFLKLYSFLAFLIIVFLIFPSCIVIYDALIKGKRATRSIFLITLAISGIFTGGLFTGLFDSISVSADCYIDLSYCTIVFQEIQNVGLSGIEIVGLRIDNITYTFTSVPYNGVILSRGDSALFVINYMHNEFVWWDYPLPSEWAVKAVIEGSPFEYNGRISPNTYVTPLTFHVGGKYPVVVKTRTREHHFLLEARLTAEEDFNILWAQGKILSGKSNRIDLSFRFNNTGNSLIYIYNIQIENLTLRFSPPLLVMRQKKFEDILIDLHYDGKVGYSTSALWYGKIVAEPLSAISTFIADRSYGVVIWTMTNNRYSTAITMSLSL